MTKADQLSTALDDFLAISPEVEAAAVVSADGLPMASALPPHVEEDRLAAMSAALLTLGERAASELGKGGLAEVFIEGPKGHVILMAAGRDCVLVCVTARGAKVGLVLFEMRRIAERVTKVMDEADAPIAFDVVPGSPAPANGDGDSPLGGAAGNGDSTLGGAVGNGDSALGGAVGNGDSTLGGAVPATPVASWQ